MFRTPLISRRDLIRAALLAGATSVFAPALAFGQTAPAETTPAQHGVDDSRLLADPNWKPALLSDQQNETLIALSEAIIPATDTPGAKAALVNRFLDLVLSGETEELQRPFIESLAYVDSESRRLFDKNFSDLHSDQQNELLQPWAYSVRNRWFSEEHADPGPQHFNRLKSAIAMAYYTSEIGQKELGWDGSFTHGPFRGCQHAPAAHSGTPHNATSHN